MIRKSSFSLRYANAGKVQKLDVFMKESVRVVNLYIDVLWNRNPIKFVSFKVDTWLSARMQQCLGKQASEIVKSQRNHPRRNKTKPVFRRPVVNLDSRFVDIRFDENSFDVWVKLSSLGNGLSLKLPSKKHRHYLGLLEKGYTLKKSARLRECSGGYELDLYLEREESPKKTSGSVIGLDCGYKKLLASSSGDVYDNGLEGVYDKIARKRQGSKAFRRALVERDNLINQTINGMSFGNVLEVVVEDLKDVKKKSRGKIRKKFNNRLQRWSYPKVLGKLSRACEESGVFFTKVDPAYTSQRCSLCGAVHKESRNGERFKCIVCGYESDADINAAVNISHMGAYSPCAI